MIFQPFNRSATYPYSKYPPFLEYLFVKTWVSMAFTSFFSRGSTSYPKKTVGVGFEGCLAAAHKDFPASAFGLDAGTDAGAETEGAETEGAGDTEGADAGGATSWRPMCGRSSPELGLKPCNVFLLTTKMVFLSECVDLPLKWSSRKSKFR